MRKFHLIVVAVALLAGCAKQDPLFCDIGQPCTAGHSYCDLDGVCPASGGHGNTCIPEACWDAGSFEVDANTTGDAQLSPDATPDGNSSHSFAIAYVNRWIAPPDAASINGGVAVVINTGALPVDLTTLTYVSDFDDHPQVDLNFRLSVLDVPTNTALQPGQASGLLGPAAESLIISSGLVPETRVDTTEDYFRFDINALGVVGDVVVVGEAIFELEGVQIILPYEVTIVAVPTASVTMLEASRITVP